MNQDVKRLWVAALRSGRWAQGFEGLVGQDGESRCCLGVLCECAPAGAIDADWIGWGTLPADAREWSGVDSEYGPSLVIDGATLLAAAHNDDHRATFAQIADAIESQL